MLQKTPKTALKKIKAPRKAKAKPPSLPKVHTPSPSDSEEKAPDPRYTDSTVRLIRASWRTRQDWHKEEKSATIRATAICRRRVGVRGKDDKEGIKKAQALLKRIETFLEDIEAKRTPEPLNEMELATADILQPLLHARNIMRAPRQAIEKDLEKIATKLPVAPWIKSVKGVGMLSLAEIVGEAGAVGEYRTVAGLWSRMGLAVIDGERQRRKKGEEGKVHAFSPERGAVMFNIGGGLIGGMGHGPRPLINEDISTREDLSEYQKLFIDRCRYECEKNPEHKRPDATRKEQVFESYSKHAANRARRYVCKRFMLHLWQHWRKIIHGASPC